MILYIEIHTLNFSYYTLKMPLDESEVYKAYIYVRNYQIGMCFTCQKCLYCAKNLTFKKCLYNKNEKPAKGNRTAKVRGYKGLYYDASSC